MTEGRERKSARAAGDAAAEAKPPSYAVPAVAKALEILELLAGEGRSLGMAEIGRRLDRSMGEIYRIVVELERRGYVARHDDGEKYVLSLKLFEMAHQHPPTERLIALAEPVLETLAITSGQSGHLGVIDGRELVILAKADSPLPMHYSVKIGARFPVLETSSGIVILAHREAARRVPFLEGLDEAARDALDRRFAEARRTGRERHPSTVVSGVTNLSAPIIDHAGRAIAALTIPYLAQLRLPATVEETETQLVAAARTLSGNLGARTDGDREGSEPE